MKRSQKIPSAASLILFSMLIIVGCASGKRGGLPAMSRSKASDAERQRYEQSVNEYWQRPEGYQWSPRNETAAPWE